MIWKLCKCTFSGDFLRTKVLHQQPAARRAFSDANSETHYCMLEFPSPPISTESGRWVLGGAEYTTVPGRSAEQAGRVIKGYECDDVWRGYSRRANMKHTPRLHCRHNIYKIFLLGEYICIKVWTKPYKQQRRHQQPSEIRHRCLRWSIGWHWRGWNERAGLWATESRAERKRRRRILARSCWLAVRGCERNEWWVSGERKTRSLSLSLTLRSQAKLKRGRERERGSRVFHAHIYLEIRQNWWLCRREKVNLLYWRDIKIAKQELSGDHSSCHALGIHSLT